MKLEVTLRTARTSTLHKEVHKELYKEYDII